MASSFFFSSEVPTFLRIVFFLPKPLCPTATVARSLYIFQKKLILKNYEMFNHWVTTLLASIIFYKHSNWPRKVSMVKFTFGLRVTILPVKKKKDTVSLYRAGESFWKIFRGKLRNDIESKMFWEFFYIEIFTEYILKLVW